MYNIKLVDQEKSVNSIIREKRSGKNLEFFFFYGHHQPEQGVDSSCLSQWFMREFAVDYKMYSCMEQYMMNQKALVFNDKEVADKIMFSKTQSEIKKLGRLVKGFDQKTWNNVKYSIVYKGNMQKFLQNRDLLEFLLGTGDKILVEASKYDKVWGIGMDKHNRFSDMPEQWLGSNLLGFALTQVRDTIRKG